MDLDSLWGKHDDPVVDRPQHGAKPDAKSTRGDARVSHTQIISREESDLLLGRPGELHL
jgi:hypothetical protein